MVDDAAQSRALAQIFPSELWWENSSGDVVSAADIVGALSTYQQRFAFVRQFLEPEARRSDLRALAQRCWVDRERIDALVATLDLPDENACVLSDVAFALAGWHVTGWYQKLIDADRTSVMQRAKRIGTAARKLAEELAGLPPEVLRLWERLLPGGCDAISMTELERQSHNIAVVSERLLQGLGRHRGRGPDQVLRTTVNYLADAREQAMGDNIQIGRSADREKPRLKGSLGASSSPMAPTRRCTIAGSAGARRACSRG